MAIEYYLIIDEAQKGPFSFEQLRGMSIGPDMLVWKAGLPDWTKASELPELFELINTETISNNGQYNSQQYGPNRPDGAQGSDAHNPGYGKNPQYGQWPNYGQSNFGQSPQYGQPSGGNPQYGQQGYGQRPDFSNNPQYGQPQPTYGAPNYGQDPRYGQGAQNDRQPGYGQQPNNGPTPGYGQQPNYGADPLRQNWQTWAIIATIAGFLFSCVGGIFGIIGIVQANKANNLYRAGYDQMGDQANNTAKVMTIIGLVLSGIGLLGTTWIFNNGGGLFSLF